MFLNARPWFLWHFEWSKQSSLYLCNASRPEFIFKKKSFLRTRYFHLRSINIFICLCNFAILWQHVKNTHHAYNLVNCNQKLFYKTVSHLWQWQEQRQWQRGGQTIHDYIGSFRLSSKWTTNYAISSAPCRKSTQFRLVHK